MDGRIYPEQEISEIIGEVIANVRHREEAYLPSALPLSQAQKDAVKSFFPQSVLDQVWSLELNEHRVPNPSFQQRARQSGHKLMLDYSHMAEITHPRLIIFQEKVSSRLLFHSLVHVVQYAVLGLERYLELYVRAFLQLGNYAGVPLEVQAFQMDRRYTEDPAHIFSVESEVREWDLAGKYLLAASPSDCKHAG